MTSSPTPSKKSGVYNITEDIRYGVFSGDPVPVSVPTLTTNCKEANFTQGGSDYWKEPVIKTCVWYPNGTVWRGMNKTSFKLTPSSPLGIAHSLVEDYDASASSRLQVDYVEKIPYDAMTIVLGNLGIKKLPQQFDTDPDHQQAYVVAQLFLANNSLTSCTDTVFPLSLINLNLANNTLASFEPRQISQLITLDLSGNTNLSTWKFPLSIQNLYINNVPKFTLNGATLPSKLTLLSAKNCSLTTVVANFPPTLKHLYLGYNNITAFYATESQYKILENLKNSAVVGQSLSNSFLTTSNTNQSCQNHTMTRMLFNIFPICILADAVPNKLVIDTTTQETTSSSTVPIVISVCAAIVLVIVVFLWIRHTINRRKTSKWFAVEDEGNSTATSTTLNLSLLVNDIRYDDALAACRIPVREIECLHVLAKGGYGIIYLAKFGSFHVAMKRLQSSRLSDVSSIQNFMDEIRLCAKLEHPKVVQFIGISWTSLRDLSAFYEYMTQGDLRDIIKKDYAKVVSNYNKKVNTSHRCLQYKPDLTKLQSKQQASILAILADVSEALIYLHSYQPIIIHRDIKAKNVLLNDDFVAKLSDFGISRDVTTDYTMTMEVGTTAWIAPEILKGERYNEMADLYSFGVLMSEIDTMLPPYKDLRDDTNEADGIKNKMTNTKIAMLVVQGKLQPTFTKDCPIDVLDIARKCLAYDASDRPNAAQLVYWLRKLAKHYQPEQ